MPNSEHYSPASKRFVTLYTEHEQQLRSYTRTLTPSWADADEIVQATALTAWQKFDDFEEDTSFKAWVFAIARFKALDHRRKMARDRLSFREEIIELMADEGREESEQREAEIKALEGCLKALPDKKRRWVTLAYTPGFTSKQLAEDMGIPPKAFYMRLNRIRQALRACVKEGLKEVRGGTA